MTTSSANPDELDAFVTGGPATRSDCESTSNTGIRVAPEVQSRCGSRGLSTTNFPAVAALLENMQANEEFVRGVADALRTADVHDGIAVMSDTAIASQFASGSYDTATTAVTIEAVTLLGEPANSGLVDDPICAANGNFIHRDHDLAFPALSASMHVHRFYNSLAADRVGAFGAGWSSLFDVALRGIDTSVITAQLADGAVIAFVADADDTWSTTDRRHHRLGRTADGWEMSSGPAGERSWRFDVAGRLVGWQVGLSTVDVERDGTGSIHALSQPRSGRRIDVTWTDGLITTLTTDDGRRLAYTYGDADTLVRAESAAGWFDYSYDGRLMLTAVDPDGVAQFVNVYDADGRVAQQTSPFGRVTSYRYEIHGSTVITDERGVRQAMVHDGRGNLTAVIDADGSAMRMTYDDRDRVVRVVSKLGDVVEHEFDQITGDLVRRIDPDGLDQTWGWDDRGRLTATTDRAGATTRMEYEGEFPTPVRVIGPDGSVATATLNEWGQPVTITDADGMITHLAWDDDGQLVASTDALGNATVFEFDRAGLLVRLVDPTGVATSLEHDAGGRVVRTTCGDLATTYRYTAAGRVDGGVEPGDVPWSARFGSNGAMAAVSDAYGATVTYDYDTSGNVTSVTAPDGAVFRQEYDDVGRLVAAIGADGATSHKRYDREGRLTEFVDPAGRTMRRTLDAFGRTLASTAPDGATTRWTYHPNGEIASVTEPDGRTWVTEIDVFGRVTAVVDPAGGRATCRFSPAGRLLARASPAGRTETYEYDAAGRCVAAIRPDGARREVTLDERGRLMAVTTGDRTINYEWDTSGQLAAAVGDRGSRRFERDAGGRVVREVDGSGATTEFSYDRRGLITAATDPAGLTTTFGYDVRGRLIEQTVPGGRTTAWAFDTAGYINQVIDPAGVQSDITRDLSGIVTGRRAGGIGWTRDLDPAGREIVRAGLDGSVLGRYSYDAVGRMTTAESPSTGLFTEFLWDEPSPSDAARADHQSAGFASAFDAAGRLMAAPDGTAYRYDSAGRLVEVLPPDTTPTAFEYGDDGLIVAEHGPAGTRRFTHDAAGRVDTITIPGAGTTTIDYDAAGRRVAETAPDGSVTEYGWNAIDQLVSITRIDRFGETRTVAIDVDALGRPRRINGVDVDAGTTEAVVIDGLVLLGARVYEPATRQFLSADPLMTVPGSNGAASAYTYAWHDPVNYIDPTGLKPISIEDYQAIREREEQGRLGQAWEAIKEDPWGTLAIVGVVAVGVGCMFIPGAQAIGVGILVGAAMTGGVGIATGNFSPRQVAIGGVIGGLTAGTASAGASIGRTVLTGGMIGSGGDLAGQVVSGQPINWNQVLVAGGAGALTAGVGARTAGYTTTATRSAAVGAATDTTISAAQQVLTGQNPLSTTTLAAALSGGTVGTLTHRFNPTTNPDITPPIKPDAKPVIVDTNMVYDRAGTAQLLQAGETPVITATVSAELANNAARGRLKIPSYVGEFGVVPDAMNVNTRINIRAELAATRPNQAGLFGDGAIGATALETGTPIITRDKRLADVLQSMGAEVRRP